MADGESLLVSEIRTSDRPMDQEKKCMYNSSATVRMKLKQYENTITIMLQAMILLNKYNTGFGRLGLLLGFHTFGFFLWEEKESGMFFGIIIYYYLFPIDSVIFWYT